ncbi:MAG: hypothetical protein LN415_08510, partial [Candidatus Thermoplasmatota archaeon]|nr:hypothetical protein [Candidatus Thermoplasmatota archaeon]
FWWADGTSHTIDVVTPQPAGTGEQYAWTSWSDSGTQSHSVTATQSETIIATFGLEYEVTIASTPAGRDITVDSTLYVTPQTFWVASGGSLDVQGTSPQPGATGTQYVFNQWSDGPSTFARTITVTAASTYTAQFTTEYEVTITTNPAGMQITVDSNTLTTPQTFWWADGASHDIDVVTPQAGATADQRYAFATWSDSGTKSHSVTVDQSETITATFDVQYQVTVTTSPAGRVFREGTTDHTGPSTFWVTSGGSLIISGTSPQPAGATDTRYEFASWADGPTTFARTITVTAASTYTAQFTTQYYLTVVSDKGTPTGQGWHDAGTQATFSVTSPVTVDGVEYAFTGWSGDSTESGKSSEVLMDAAKTVEAKWEESGFLTKFWWIFPIIIIIIIAAIVAIWMMKRKKPEEEELPPPEEMEIPPEEEEV